MEHRGPLPPTFATKCQSFGALSLFEGSWLFSGKKKDEKIQLLFSVAKKSFKKRKEKK